MTDLASSHELFAIRQTSQGVLKRQGAGCIMRQRDDAWSG